MLNRHAVTRRTTVTVKVVDLETDQVLLDSGGDRLLVPASNLKSYTTACALDTFGPTKTFPTRLLVHGSITEDVLSGDLVLVGGGNSMLSSGELAELAERVTDEWSIVRVEGSVRVDNSRYAPTLKGPGWMWDDDPSYYNMSITPLMLDFNVLTVRLAPEADGTVAASLVPASDYPPLVRIGSAAIRTGPRVTRRPFTEPMLFVDQGAIDEAEETRLTMHDPGPWVAAVFRQMLADRGVTVVGTSKAKWEENESGAAKPLIHDGVPLATTLKHFNEKSENAVGEVLLHEIAIARGTRQPCWDDGAKAITDWLINTAGLEPGSFRYVDGSGLSRYNLISADSAVKLLSFMDEHEHRQAFVTAMPKYAVDLEGITWLTESRDAAGDSAWLVAAKSGYMSGVSTSSGYVNTLSGRRLAFSVLANGFMGAAEPVRDLRMKLWRVLVRYTGG